jgi:hypothetical protein
MCLLSLYSIDDDSEGHTKLLAKLHYSLKLQVRMYYVAAAGIFFYMLGEEVAKDETRAVAFSLWCLCSVVIMGADSVFSVVVTIAFLKRECAPAPCTSHSNSTLTWYLTPPPPESHQGNPGHVQRNTIDWTDQSTND